VINSFHEMLDRHPAAMPQMLSAADALLANPLQIVIATRNPADDPLLRIAQAAYQPRRILLLAGEQGLAQQVPELRGMDLIDGRSAAYVCRNFTCELPIIDPEALATKLGGISRANSRNFAPPANPPFSLASQSGRCISWVIPWKRRALRPPFASCSSILMLAGWYTTLHTSDSSKPTDPY
jgi:hypothetical protein